MRYSPDPVAPKWPGYGVIAAVCGLVYFLQLISQYVLAPYAGGQDLVTSYLILDPVSDATVVYRMLTYAFVHGGIWHLLFNMIVLVFTARSIEEYMGRKNTVVLYLAAVYFCGLFTALHCAFIRESSVLGASGAIAALLFIYWRMNPDAQVLLFFIIPMPIRYVMYGVITLDFLGTVFPLKTGLAHATHFGGYVFGWLYLRHWDNMLEWFENRGERLRLKVVRTEQLKAQAKKSYYDNEIDPILKKISEQGVESLSDIEKQILKKAGKKK